jgi:hypothetical protein
MLRSTLPILGRYGFRKATKDELDNTKIPAAGNTAWRLARDERLQLVVLFPDSRLNAATQTVEYSNCDRACGGCYLMAD